MPSSFYQKNLSDLQAAYPEAALSSVTYQVSQDFFDMQKEIETEGEIKGFTSVIILSQNDQIILAKKEYGAPGWALPGGAVEAGENFHEGAEREILEEIGVRLEDLTLLMIEEETFLSPSGEKAHSLLGVFGGCMKKFSLPPLTEEARKEGLTLKLFDLDALPDEMALTDRDKIDAFLSDDDDADD